MNVDGGKNFKALIKEIQQNPVNDQVVHVDFYALDMTKPVTLPIQIVLEGKPKGAISGGLLQQVKRRTEVSCLPAVIPVRTEGGRQRPGFG